ncbi:hypothetical protein [Mycolicibacterium wolinskyi]|uniref:hypothetical protein n=1 Tax=Mycolicibacterium wolinskyi TaxID=59750 RepID=UPI0039179EED
MDPTLGSFRAELAADLAEIAAGADWTKIRVRWVDLEEGELQITTELRNGELRSLEYDGDEYADLIFKSTDLLGTMLPRGDGRWLAYSVGRHGEFEFFE